MWVLMSREVSSYIIIAVHQRICMVVTNLRYLIITKAHLGTNHASAHVKLPTNEPVTIVGFNPKEQLLTAHVYRSIDNEYLPRACATNLIGSGNASNVARNWNWHGWWHRVVIYGDFRRGLEEFTRLLGLGFA